MFTELELLIPVLERTSESAFWLAVVYMGLEALKFLVVVFATAWGVQRVIKFLVSLQRN